MTDLCTCGGPRGCLIHDDKPERGAMARIEKTDPPTFTPVEQRDLIGYPTITKWARGGTVPTNGLRDELQKALDDTGKQPLKDEACDSSGAP